MPLRRAGSPGAPLSLHPRAEETGEPIVWYDFDAPGEVLLGDLENAVARLAAVALLARHWPAKGTRQDAFLALVAGLLRGGWPIGRVESFVEALAAVTNDEEPRKRVQIVAPTAEKLQRRDRLTGWPTLEDRMGHCGKPVVHRVCQWLRIGQGPASEPTLPKKRVRELGAYELFPVDVLPPPIQEFVRQSALALGCDPALVALPVLAVIASLIGNTRAIRLKRGWEELCILWTVIVRDSGTLKSPAFSKAVGYLFRLQKQLLLEYRQRCIEYQNQKQEYEAAKRAAKENGTDPGEPPGEPVLARGRPAGVFRLLPTAHITDETSPEDDEDDRRPATHPPDETRATPADSPEKSGEMGVSSACRLSAGGRDCQQGDG